MGTGWGSVSTSRAGRAGAVVALLLALAAPGRAAADTTFHFDDLAPNTTVTSQYGVRGVTFGPTAPGQAQTTANVPVAINVGSAAAQSGAQVGRVARRCVSTECVGTTEVWLQFSGGPRSRVSVSVGTFGTASATISLAAFTSSGATVATTSQSPTQASVTGGRGFRTRLTTTSLSTNIAFVRIRSSSVGPFGIDDVTIDTPPPPAPRFSIRPRGATSLNVLQGGAGGIDLVIDRVNFSGTVRLTGDQPTFPSRVTMTPLDSTGSSQSIVRVTFVAQSTAPLTAGRQVRILATPTVKGVAAQSTTITVNVVAVVDSRVTGIEVTQGVQTLGLPFANTSVPSTKNYTGVPLYANGATVVRVYANNGRTYFPSGSVPGATMRLHGVNAATGATLGLSPILPDAGPSALAFGASDVPIGDERRDPLRAFTFTLPASWVGTGVRTTTNQQGFNLRLRAELVLQPSQTLFETTSANNSMTLDRVVFTPTCCLDVATVLLRHDDFPGDPRPIRTVLREGLNVTPLEANVPDYQGTLNATDEIDDPPKDANGNPLDSRSVIAAKLIEFSQRTPKNDVVVGFGIAGFPACGGAVPFVVCDDLPDRPYTSSAHEFLHALGAVVEDATFSGCVDGDLSCHASRACDANNSGTVWPPDQIGLLQGIGLDRTVAPPYRILATPDGVPATVGEQDDRGIYDFMSYCAGDSNSWLGPKNWTDVLNRFARNGSPAGSARLALTGRAQAAQTPPPPKLVVNAVASASGGVGITSVSPGVGDRGAGSRPTPYVLVVRDAAGPVLAQVPMRGRGDHFHGRPVAQILTGVASVPVARAQRVEVVRDGAVVAERRRSATAPTARFLSPGRGRLVGRTDKLAIRWRARDADGDKLRVIVEWSARGGRPGTWRDVFVGPNGGRVSLPSEYFGGSDDAFLRLRVSDGFNETVVLSPPFRTIHRRPTVSIASPRPGRRTSQGATLSLRAVALDERGQSIGRAGLRWFEGRRALGRGEQLGVADLAPGRHRIRLVATDAGGRRATAAVTVRVVPVTPRLERIAAPARIGTRARRVVLRVASTVPATLTVTGRGVVRTRARVDRRTRRVIVAVRPGGRPLQLRLLLSSGGRAMRAEVGVER